MQTFKILSGFGSQQVDEILARRIQEATLEKLTPLTLIKLYEKTKEQYDVLIFRDGAIDVKINIISTIKRLREISPNTKMIFILEAEYDAVIEDYITKEKDVIFMRNTNIETLIKTINIIFNELLDKNNIIDEEDEEDFIFDLTTMTEIETTPTDDTKNDIEKYDKNGKSKISLSNEFLNGNKKSHQLESERNELLSKSKKGNYSKHTIFPIKQCDISKNENIILYLNSTHMDSQMAIQMASFYANDRDVVYIDYIKSNHDFVSSVTKGRLTIITPAEQGSLISILGLIKTYRISDETLFIINVEYNEELLNFAVIGKVYVEITQNMFLIESLIGDNFDDSLINLQYIVSYYDETMISQQDIEDIFRRKVLLIHNTRVMEFLSRKNKKLIKGDM